MEALAPIVESISRGRGVRHILAKRLYAHLGEKGSYTRRKGLDRETNKALLLNHIVENASEGSRFHEFQQVLPALSRDQIRTLLKDLKKEGKIRNVGIRKATIWYPANRENP